MNKALIVALLMVVTASAIKVRDVQFIQMYNKEVHSYVHLETGYLDAMANDGNDWHTVNLQQNYQNPVVLAQIITYNGGHPCHIRVKNVETNSFQFKIEEWEYLDEWHTTETIQWIVAEEGTYELSCGQQIVVGSYYPSHEQWITINFPSAFNGTPVVMTQCQTENGGDAVVTRHTNIGSTSFAYKLQEQESFGEHPAAETVGYLAIEQGSCGTIFAQNGDNVFDENWETFVFTDYIEAYVETPIVMAQMQTTNGGNTAGLRMTGLSETQVQVFVEEEQSGDSETNHVNEVVGFLAIGQPHITAEYLETGYVDINADDHNDWHTVSLTHTYDNPVVVASISTYNGGHPVHVRVKNVDSKSFQLKLEEWEYLDEVHTTETVHYVVADKGTYELPCGQQILVGDISDMHQNWQQSTFEYTFQNTPVVMTQCQTENGGDAVVTRHKEINREFFQVKLQEQEAFGDHPMAEIVGYIAMEQGYCQGVFAGNGEEIFDEVQETFSFTDAGASFDEAPFLLTQMQTTNGGNTANMRTTALTSDSCTVFVEEEQSGDDETNHLNEVVGFIAIAPSHFIELEVTRHCSEATLFLQE